MIAAAFIIGSSITAGIAMSAENELPFKLKVAAIEQSELDAGLYTIATLELENGPHFIKDVKVVCRVRNDKGYSWDLNGMATVISADEVRRFRITNFRPLEKSGPFVDPTSVACRVTAYESGD